MMLEEKIERHQSEQQDTQSLLEDVQKANTSLMEQLKEERQLSSSLMKEREKEKKKLREMHEVKDVAVQFDYIVTHSGVCVCVHVDTMFVFFRFNGLYTSHYSWTKPFSSTRRQASLIPMGEVWIQITLSSRSSVH